MTESTPADWTSFTATSGSCSCDFYKTPNNAADDTAKLDKKYRKKGWSEPKIYRALEAHKAQATQPAGLQDDILDLVTELANTFGELRLSLHWYSGDIETEVFSLKDVGSISLEDFRRDATALEEEATIRIEGEQVGAGQPHLRRRKSENHQ